MKYIIGCIALLIVSGCGVQEQPNKILPSDQSSTLTCNQTNNERINCMIASTTEQPINKQNQKNLLGEDLKPCSTNPLTGRYRDGFCSADENDKGIHVVCAELTDEFLQYSKNLGNDLITPNPSSRFPGLVAGDRRCLCAARWLEAEQAGVEIRVIEEATHESVRPLRGE